MNIAIKANLKLEILLSTMNRNSLSFLEALFPGGNYRDYNILIINQTSGNHLIESELPNIRVINSFEKGLSKSRNLAIKNAIGDICLIADDDVIFEKDFSEKIIQAFKNNKDAVLITFKALDLDNNSYRIYHNKDFKHNLKSIKNILSIEIAFNNKLIREANVYFDERFGLGGEFKTGEEFLFSRILIEKGYDVCFCNQFIVSHHIHNSGKELGSEEIVYARAALNYKIHKKLTYIWLFKYMIFLLQHKDIKPKQAFNLFKIGLKGIKDFKTKDGEYNN